MDKDNVDLLEAFGNPSRPARDLVSERAKSDITFQEEDEFGDFEESNNASRAKDDKNQSPSLELTQARDVLDLHDDSGNFEEEHVLFDAEQTVTLQGKRVSHVQVPKSSRSIISTELVHNLASPTKTPSKNALETTMIDNGPRDLGNSSLEVLKPSSFLPYADENASRRIGTKAQDAGMPPPNVPPPSVLLPVVGNTFRSVVSDIKLGITSSLSTDSKKTLVDESLGIARAGAKIVAGRKLRWKRDRTLSQGMKIGPATGKISGMKLTSLDKTESRREDSEAIETVRIWMQCIATLRPSLANTDLQVTLPEISQAMPIKAMKASEGAVFAPKCCFLCGIRREERVVKVDVDIEDSFGEFWIENWGHTDCVTFWTDLKGSLPQR